MPEPRTLPPDTMDAIRNLFFQECDELITSLEADLLALQHGADDDETINAVFRAVHSIKGSAGAFGLDALGAFAHRFESVLARLRSGELKPDPILIKLLLRASDVIADLVRLGREDAGATPPEAAEVAEDLLGYAWTTDEILDLDVDLDFTPRPVAGTDQPADRAEPARWRIEARPDWTFYAKGGEFLPLLRELARLGEIEVILDDHELPMIDDLDPEQAYLAWTVMLTTNASEAMIRDVFSFVEGEWELDIEAAPAPPPGSRQAAIADAAHSEGEPGRSEVRRDRPANETLRVDLARVDKIVNLVGELLIGHAIFGQRLREIGGAAASLPTDDIEQIARELQDSVMGLRAQPVKVVFQRLPRLARELEAATGKLIDLVIEGEDNEVDRTVIERLADPLTHMIRNAVDHGVEAPDVRVARGKPPRGVVRVRALHRTGRIVIEVSDDGAGVDRARVRDIAVAKGIVDAGAPLSDEDIDGLIFRPGFSTATELSDLSGRGVGLDVVKRGVEALGGRIGISSAPGRGATVTMSLPLTLAVLDGMAVRVRGHKFIAPLTALVEAAPVRPEDLRPLGPDLRLLNLRGAYLPLIDLGVLFRYSDRPATQGVALVVEDDHGVRAAILVDETLGRHQAVIRSLEANYGQIDGVSAATILGDGQVAFILDVHAILAPLRREALLEAIP